MCWLVSYPFDILKTVLQTSLTNLSLLEVATDKYKQHGVMYFYRGILPTITRSFVVNGICMPVFDCLSRF
jgi:hypothetical protein